MSKSLPNYIDYANDIVQPMPGKVLNAQMYCFLVDADATTLQNLVDEHYNFATHLTGKKYFLLSDDVLFAFATFANGSSQDPTYPKKGTIGETGLNAFVRLAECTQNSDGEWVAERMLIGCPYIFVDNPFSMAAGREVYGFPKTLAQFQIPQAPSFTKQFYVSSFGLRKFNVGDVAGWYPLLEFESNANDFGHGSWGSIGEVLGDIGKLFQKDDHTETFKKGFKFYAAEFQDLLSASVPLIFLKQFRDAEDNSKACYQALIEAPANVLGFHGGWFMKGDYTLKLHDFDSYPIASNMGITNNSVAKMAFWANVDLEFGLGKELVKTS